MGLRPRILKIPKEEDPIVQNSIDIELAVEKVRQKLLRQVADIVTKYFWEDLKHGYSCSPKFLEELNNLSGEKNG